MNRLFSVSDIRSLPWHGVSVGFVPTMGALHDGHLALVEAARQRCERVVVSIFVNPTQFGANEDFSRYPRPVEADCALLEAAGVDAVFLPDAAAMYPPDHQPMLLDVGDIGNVLCGAHRPGHFNGVATVVLKLLQIVQSTIAFFGEKDWQQLCIIRGIVRQFFVPVTIEGVTTVRAADGLALSSRNAYLSAAERQIAPALYRTLQQVAAGKLTLNEAPLQLLAAGFASVDYVMPFEGRLCAAVRLGSTRLIDNICL